MAIDYERLLHFAILEVRQRYSRKDSALYALSVGFGQDPMDERQLRFVGMVAVSLAYPRRSRGRATRGLFPAHPARPVHLWLYLPWSAAHARRLSACAADEHQALTGMFDEFRPTGVMT